MELFKIQNLTFTYPEQDEPVLRNVTMALRQGDFAVLPDLAAAYCRLIACRCCHLDAGLLVGFSTWAFV